MPPEGMCAPTHLLRFLRHFLIPQEARVDFSLRSKARCLCANTLSARSSSKTDLKFFYSSDTFKSKPTLQNFLALPVLPHPPSPCDSLMKGRSLASCKDILRSVLFVAISGMCLCMCVCEYSTKFLWGKLCYHTWV